MSETPENAINISSNVYVHFHYAIKAQKKLYIVSTLINLKLEKCIVSFVFSSLEKYNDGLHLHLHLCAKENFKVIICTKTENWNSSRQMLLAKYFLLILRQVLLQRQTR